MKIMQYVFTKMKVTYTPITSTVQVSGHLFTQPMQAPKNPLCLGCLMPLQHAFRSVRNTYQKGLFAYMCVTSDATTLATLCQHWPTEQQMIT